MRLQRNRATLRRALLLVLACAAGMLIASSCQQTPDTGAEKRLAEIESTIQTSMAGVDGLATQVQALEGKEQGIEGQVAALNQSIAELQGKIDEVSRRVAASSGSDAELKKKLDAVSGQVGGVSTKVGAIEQKISLLETRYNDHLRKFHGGG
ncbi:MAG TPA: hypothetical protein VM754_12550 [Actinomycetota bacterium]|nr:hypothetical protein [Actinomycetota bacterium]